MKVSQRLTLLTALSLAASTACGDEPSSPWADLPELPPHCSRDQRMQRLTEIGDLEQRFTVLAARASRPRTSASFDGDPPEAAAVADEMLASLRDLLALPCLEHAAPLLSLPEYARWRSITFAVDSGLPPLSRQTPPTSTGASRPCSSS